MTAVGKVSDLFFFFFIRYAGTDKRLPRHPAFFPVLSLSSCRVSASSPSRGGDVAVHVFDISQPSLPTPFYSVVVFIVVFMALSPVFHSINSPDNSPLSHSVLPVLFLPYWSFQLLVMKVSITPDIILCG